MRSHVAYCYGRAAEEAAAAHRGNDRIRVRYLISQLHCRGPLTGDDVKVIIGMNHRGAGPFNNLRGGGLPCRQRGLTEGDLRAITCHRSLLHPGRRGGHHNIGLHPAHRCRMSEGGSMIARRVRHHAGGTLAFREILHRIGGAPELEGPCLLEVLTLEEKLRATDGIKLP